MFAAAFGIRGLAPLRAGVEPFASEPACSSCSPTRPGVIRDECHAAPGHEPRLQIQPRIGQVEQCTIRANRSAKNITPGD
eukprot:15466778-Alexandrium_andersonii.AAC.1